MIWISSVRILTYSVTYAEAYNRVKIIVKQFPSLPTVVVVIDVVALDVFESLVAITSKQKYRIHIFNYIETFLGYLCIYKECFCNTLICTLPSLPNIVWFDVDEIDVLDTGVVATSMAFFD